MAVKTKYFFLESYRSLLILFWSITILFVWINFFNRYTIFASSILTISIFIPTILITNFLSNHLLKTMMAARKMKLFTFWFILFSTGLSGIYAVIDMAFKWLLEKGLLAPPRAWTEDSLLLQFMSAMPIALLINLGFCGLRFYHEHTRLQEEQLKRQLHFLQEQISPHFMFNVLNNIHTLIQKDSDLASRQLVKYADVLRYQLYEGKKESVPIRQEIDFLENVIEVEKMRWGKVLEVKTNWDIIDETQKIQPLLLIAFIENAFKHVSRSLSEKGFITIQATQKDDQFLLNVSNSKPKPLSTPSHPDIASGIGLQNIKERLSLLYPKKHILKIKETADRFSIQLIINFKDGKEKTSY